MWKFNLHIDLRLPVVLTVVFIILKLTAAIDWSWLWILSPLWIVLLGMVVLALVAGILYVMVGAVRKARRR